MAGPRGPEVMMRRQLAAVVLGLLPTAVQAQDLALPPIPLDTFTLENGLRVIVSEDHSTPVVAVDIWYDAGSAHERPGRSGFAHLFEHLMFEETENLEEGEIQRLIQQAGGEYNGTTNTDRTAYFEVLPSNRVNLALWIEAERMARLLVNEENFENQREVVKEERRLRIDNQPYGRALITRDTLATDYAPYKHSVIGSMEDLDAAAVEDVRDFYRRHYVPNNATLVVVGDVTGDLVRELVAEYFGAIPRGPEPEPLPPPPSTPRADGERRVELPDPLANTPLLLSAFSVPPDRHPDTYALALLSEVFSTGESSRLYRRLVQEEEAALTVLSGLDARLGPGTFWFGALPNPGVEVDRLEVLIDEEVERLKDEGVGERELRKAKNQLRARMVRRRLRVLSKAEEIQHYRLYHGDPFLVNEDLARFEAVTPEDVLRVARTYLVRENRTVVIAAPGGAASSGGGS